jgi:hypothetical protein
MGSFGKLGHKSDRSFPFPRRELVHVALFLTILLVLYTPTSSLNPLILNLFRGTRQLDHAIRHFRLSGDNGDSLHNLVLTPQYSLKFACSRWFMLFLGVCISFEWTK